jgi:hypothetical protein
VETGGRGARYEEGDDEVTAGHGARFDEERSPLGRLVGVERQHRQQDVHRDEGQRKHGCTARTAHTRALTVSLTSLLACQVGGKCTGEEEERDGRARRGVERARSVGVGENTTVHDHAVREAKAQPDRCVCVCV